MSEPSMGQLLLYVVFIVIAMGVLDRFEGGRVRTARARDFRHEHQRRPLASQRNVA